MRGGEGYKQGWNRDSTWEVKLIVLGLGKWTWSEGERNGKQRQPTGFWLRTKSVSLWGAEDGFVWRQVALKVSSCCPDPYLSKIFPLLHSGTHCTGHRSVATRPSVHARSCDGACGSLCHSLCKAIYPPGSYSASSLPCHTQPLLSQPLLTSLPPYSFST